MFRQDFTCPALLENLQLFTCTGLSPFNAAVSNAFQLLLQTCGLFRFRSSLLTESQLMSFPSGTKIFQFPEFAPIAGYCRSSGFPHSEILGSTLIVNSPRLIADLHVLHRL